MKPSTAALQQLIKQGYEIRCLPKLLAEWEHNRFSPIDSITVTPTQAVDAEWAEIYKIDSIGMPNRPAAGIAKARIDGSNKVKPASGYRDTPSSARYYVSTDADPYSYFSSTQKSGTVAGAGGTGYAFAIPIELTLLYEDPVIANKLVVGFETSYSKPNQFVIQTTTDGTNWTNASSSPALDNKGTVTLWWSDQNAWEQAPDYDNPQLLKGIRVTVLSMNDASTHLDVLQLGLRLENDLSDYVEGYNKSFELSDRSFIAPLGRASSNQATVTLSNIDSRFNDENVNSPYYGLIKQKAKLTMDLSFDATKFNGSADERLREFTMWVDNWGNQDQASIEVSLKDSSVFLQEALVPKLFWENLTIGAIVWQLMDILGYTNYNYTRAQLDTGQTVTYFWPDSSTTTAWDLIGGISEATQTAVYFDEYDVMQIKTRRSLFATNATIDWNLDAILNGSKLPDIVETTKTNSLAANQVDIKYKPAHYSDFNNGLPKMETVWQPEDDTVVLRGSSLVRDLLKTDTVMYITQTEAAVWPYECDVNIRGEILHYKGKEYAYRLPNGSTAYGIVYSKDDQARFDGLSDQGFLWANVYTGKFYITQRNIGNSGLDDHFVRPSAYTGTVTNVYNTVFRPASVNMNYNSGYATIVSPVGGAGDIYLVNHQAVITSANTTYGMKFRFPKPERTPDNWAVGGLRLAGDWGDTGYYIEFSTTDTIEKIEKRTARNELSLCVMPGNAPMYRVDKGIEAEIVLGNWYTVDAFHSVNADGSATVSVILNGVEVGQWQIPANKRPPDTGKFGMWVRGWCNMDVEYLYAVHNAPIEDMDNSSYLDLATGGFTSGYIQRDWRYGSFTTAGRGPAAEGGYWFIADNYRAEFAFDEFGPVVHEIREFNVVFDDSKIPVVSSYPYFSNTSQVVCTNYWADPFGAKFTLVNAYHQTAILSGDDDVTFGVDNTINQKFFVYGRALYQDDDQTLTKKDDQSIRINGTVALEFDNPYIQNEAHANELGQWIIDQWSAGSDEIHATINGNPLLQLGDKATVNYPVKGMYPSTHQYYVVSLSNSFDAGLSTDLILRRAKV